MEEIYAKEGNLFIIPNAPATSEECVTDEMFRRYKKLVHRCLSPEYPEDKTYVQVWAATPGDQESNWSAHRELTEYEESFPVALPAYLIKSLKEGDSFTLTLRYGMKVKLTARQLNYRYKRFGSFEQVLEKLGV